MAATMRQVRIEVMPDTRLSKNGLRRSNWRTSQALVKQARDDAFFLGLAEKPADWQTPAVAAVEIVQYYARRPLDFDGLACAVAPSLDGLVDAAVLEDDSPDHVGTYAMRHEKVKTVRENRISITITPVRESERIGYER